MYVAQPLVDRRYDPRVSNRKPSRRRRRLRRIREREQVAIETKR